MITFKVIFTFIKFQKLVGWRTPRYENTRLTIGWKASSSCSFSYRESGLVVILHCRSPCLWCSKLSLLRKVAENQGRLVVFHRKIEWSLWTGFSFCVTRSVASGLGWSRWHTLLSGHWVCGLAPGSFGLSKSPRSGPQTGAQSCSCCHISPHSWLS